jgi:hypothetical protein
MEPLADAAERIHRLGPVRWCSVGEIVLSNFDRRDDAGAVAVRAWARRIRVDLPADAQTLTVHAPLSAGVETGLAGWSLDREDLPPTSLGATRTVTRPRAQAVVARLRPHGEIDPQTVADPAVRAWPRLRRLATESRDRSRPLRRRVTRAVGIST